MNWNPWKKIKRLEDEIVALNAECDALYQRTRDAEKEAFWKAEDHFKRQTANLQQHNDHLMQALVEMKSLEPILTQITLPPKDISHAPY